MQPRALSAPGPGTREEVSLLGAGEDGPSTLYRGPPGALSPWRRPSETAALHTGKRRLHPPPDSTPVPPLSARWSRGAASLFPSTSTSGAVGRSEAEAVSPFVACFLTVCGGHARAEGPLGSWPVPSFRCRLTREQQTLAQGRKITRPLPAPPGGRPVYLGSTNARRAAQVPGTAHAREPPRPSDGLCSRPGPHPKSVLSQFSVRIMSLCSPGRQWAT